MKNLNLNQIEKIIAGNKELFKAAQTNLIGQFISAKTGMDMVHANAIAKGLVDKLV